MKRLTDKLTYEDFYETFDNSFENIDNLIWSVWLDVYNTLESVNMMIILISL